MEDPLLENAADDLNALAKKLGEELHAQQDHVSAKTKMLELLMRYGPSLLEAALRVALKVAGVPVPPPVT